MFLQELGFHRLAAGHEFLNGRRIERWGCQMVCFQTKNPNLGKFWRALDWKMLIYFMPIRNSLQTFGIFYNHLALLCSFGTFLPVLVSCIKKNLATLNLRGPPKSIAIFLFAHHWPLRFHVRIDMTIYFQTQQQHHQRQQQQQRQ
jgi:hypothetical protein